LPRPRTDRYKGGFPLHAEIKLIRECGHDPKKEPSLRILHPFGGRAEYGIRVDVNPEVEPDVVADAHNLPFKDGTFDIVILDPPYSDELSKELYNTGKLNFRKFTSEAVRVLKESGWLIVYHWVSTPQIPNTVMRKRVLIETRTWHRPRIVHIHQKSTQLWLEKVQSKNNKGKK
jgi:SAM-dependent methyltransferase